MNVKAKAAVTTTLFIPLEPIPKKTRSLAAGAPLAPVPSAVQFLSDKDARFVAQIAQKDTFQALPTSEQRHALVLAAFHASNGIAQLTRHVGFDAGAVADQLSTTSRLIWALQKTALSQDERGYLSSAIEQSNHAADALAADEPRLWYARAKESAFGDLARATYQAHFTTFPGEVPLAKVAQDRAMAFQRAKVDNIRKLAPLVNEIRTEMTKKLDVSISALKPLSDPNTFCAALFAARHAPNLPQRLSLLGLETEQSQKLANAVRDWKTPQPWDPRVTLAHERLRERVGNLEDMRKTFASTKAGPDALAELLTLYPDMAATWCFGAGFTNTLRLPLGLSPKQVAAMEPAERAVHDALLARGSWKHTIRDLAPTMAASVAIGTALSVLSVPALVAGAATSVIVGTPRLIAANDAIHKQVDSRDVGLGSDTSIEGAKDERIATVASVAVDAVTAGIASKLGSTRGGLTLAQSLAKHFGLEAGLGAGAAVLTELGNPAFWKREQAHVGTLMEASVVGLSAGLLGASAGLALGGACKLMFMPSIARMRLRAGSEISVESNGVRSTARVLSLEAGTGEIRTNKGTFQVHDAQVFALPEDQLLHRWETAADGAVVLAPYRAAPIAKVVTFDKAKLSPAMRLVFERGTPPQQQMMRKLGDEWLAFCGTEIIGNERLAQLFSRYGDDVIVWLRKHSLEAQTIIGLDARLSGGVLDCFETKTFAELQPFLHQFMSMPVEVKAFFALSDQDEIARLIKSNHLKDALSGLVSTFKLVNNNTEIVAAGKTPMKWKTASPTERASLARAAGVSEEIFGAPANDLRALRKLVAHMRKDLSKDQAATLDLELLGRRLIDDVHFESMQSTHNPEHAYGKNQWRGWRKAEARMAKAAAEHEPLSEQLLETWHQALQPTSQGYKYEATAMVSMRRLLEQIEVEIQGGIDPVTIAARAQRALVNIHPYEDGNERMSRLVMDYVLLRSGGLPSLSGKNTNLSESAWQDKVKGGVARAFSVIESHWKHSRAGKVAP